MTSDGTPLSFPTSLGTSTADEIRLLGQCPLARPERRVCKRQHRQRRVAGRAMDHLAASPRSQEDGERSGGQNLLQEVANREGARVLLGRHLGTAAGRVASHERARDRRRDEGRSVAYEIHRLDLDGCDASVDELVSSAR